MARVIYGVWDGEVLDNRGKDVFEIGETPGLEDFGVFNQGNPILSFVSGRGFYVFSPQASLLDAARRHMERTMQESCGKCTPCRMGSSLIAARLERLCAGQGQPDDLDEVASLAEQMRDTSLCGLGRTSGVPLAGMVRHFRDVLQAEAEAGPAPALPGMSYVTAPCIEACPAKVNVPRYIDYIKDGRPMSSLGVILQKYPMAATCGRVCVRFCEQACSRSRVDAPVGIKTLKRFVADHESEASRSWFTPDMVARRKPAHLRVAVVGAGPAGISCAYHLLLMGYPVEVFEAREESGGMASCGIPSYRLPKDVLRSETTIVSRLGGVFHMNARLGRDFDLDGLFGRGFKAVFLALGCDQGRRLGVSGETPDMRGQMTGLEFLLRVHDHVEGLDTMGLSGSVVVVGGGNVAMDCVRSALRLGAREVHLVYRRDRADMPADPEEIKAAEHEGVSFHFLSHPGEVLSEHGQVTGVMLQAMTLGAPDHKGRREVEPVPGYSRFLPCDTLVAAIGQQMDPGALTGKDGVALTRWNTIQTDPNTQETTRQGVFAGGDCMLGPSTLIHAMAGGLKGARSIDDYLRFGRVRFFPRSRMRQLVAASGSLAREPEAPTRHLYRIPAPELDPRTRRALFEEVEQTISPDQAYHEASRCLRCYTIASVATEAPIPSFD